MAFTEHGNVSSHFRAEQDAAKYGIKPIFGLEAYTGPVDLDNRKRTKYHLILLAMDSAGYTNLNKVVTQSWKDFYQYPTVGGSALAMHNAGLICLSGCTGSMLACNLVGGKDIAEPAGGMNMEAALGIAERFKALFGDRYYLEVQGFPELEKTCKINPAYEIIGKELDIPLVATMDVHYPMPDDNEMQVIIHAADRGGKTIDQQSQGWEYDVRLTLPDDTNAMWRKVRATGLSRAAAIESIESAAHIASLCNVTLPKADRLQYRPTEEDMAPWTS
jgi:DNA polymerase-3 subunit alpha